MDNLLRSQLLFWWSHWLPAFLDSVVSQASPWRVRASSSGSPSHSSLSPYSLALSDARRTRRRVSTVRRSLLDRNLSPDVPDVEINRIENQQCKHANHEQKGSGSRGSAPANCCSSRLLTSGAIRTSPRDGPPASSPTASAGRPGADRHRCRGRARVALRIMATRHDSMFLI